MGLCVCVHVHVYVVCCMCRPEVDIWMSSSVASSSYVETGSLEVALADRQRAPTLPASVPRLWDWTRAAIPSTYMGPGDLSQALKAVHQALYPQDAFTS